MACLSTVLVVALLSQQPVPTPDDAPKPADALPTTTEPLPLPPDHPRLVDPPPNLVRQRAWVPTLLGSVAVVGGLTAVVVGKVQYDRAMTDDGRTYGTSTVVGGAVLALLGATLLGVSAFMWSWVPEAAHVEAAPLPGGGGLVGVGGRF